MAITGTVNSETLKGTAGNDLLQGLAGNDTLYGLGGNDRLDGGPGGDKLLGGTGNDTYIVDHINDTVTELPNQGHDTVKSSVRFTLGTNLENLTLTGTAISGVGNELANIIIGNTLGNILVGGGGNDLLNGGLGIDDLRGGIGNDTYIVNSVLDLVEELADQGIDTVESSARFKLGDNLENLRLAGTAISGVGNDLANVIVGNNVGNILIGGGSDDTLNGGLGSDDLRGGIGNDIYIVNAAIDKVDELPDQGIDTVKSAARSYTLPANVENLTLIGDTNIIGIGNDLANTLLGNSGDNRLEGGVGNDKMLGGNGNDTYIIDNVGDTITELAGQGTDTVQSPITFALGDNLENLVLTGIAANGTGNALDNILTGTANSNILDGGLGADKLLGGDGNDTYLVDNLSDTVSELLGQGTDTVQSSVSFTLAANVENLTLLGSSVSNGTGNALDNIIIGNTAANLLDGGSGNDSLLSGGGADTLTGGAGDDQLTAGLATPGNAVIGLDFKLIDGGAGNDTLAFNGNGTVIKLANYPDKITNIETIDLTGHSGNTLVLTAQDVLNVTDAQHTLTVDGDAEDTLFMGAGWTSTGVAEGCETFTQQGATLKVQTDVSIATNYYIVDDAKSAAQAPQHFTTGVDVIEVSYFGDFSLSGFGANDKLLLNIGMGSMGFNQGGASGTEGAGGADWLKYFRQHTSHRGAEIEYGNDNISVTAYGVRLSTEHSYWVGGSGSPRHTDASITGLGGTITPNQIEFF